MSILLYPSIILDSWKYVWEWVKPGANNLAYKKNREDF